MGYDKAEDGTLKVNKKEAKLVRWIFKRYIKSKSMDQVAYELNRQGISTKKGRRWNARAVRDVLSNELYLGRYNVAGVSEYVGRYRILKDGLFSRAKELRIRYENGNGAKRPPMPEDRRRAKIDRVFNEYLAFLKDEEKLLDISTNHTSANTHKGR